MFPRLFFILLLLLFPGLLKSQESHLKKDTIRLKSFNKSDTVVYDIGYNKLYFELPTVLKYLKKYSESNVGAKDVAEVLIKALERSGHKTFYLRDTLVREPQTGYVDIVSTHNKYLFSISKVIPLMLLAGEVQVHDSNNRWVSYLLITKRENGDFAGGFVEITAFLPDGNRLLETQIRL